MFKIHRYTDTHVFKSIMISRLVSDAGADDDADVDALKTVSLSNVKYSLPIYKHTNLKKNNNELLN